MRESEVVELKRTFVADLHKEIIAFLNTNGGEVYIGIEDDGSVYGVANINDVELQCVNHIRSTIKPDATPFVNYEHQSLDGKEVLKIVVNKGSMCPYYIASKGIRPEGVYVRVGTASVPASETFIKKMIQESSGNTYESARSLNQNLTFIQAEREFENAGIAFGQSQKRTLGLIGHDGCYTNLALLLSDQCEHKIKFAVFVGKEKDIFQDRHEFSGSLFRQLKDLLQIIDNNNRLSSPKLDGVRRIDERDYPQESIREAVLNAIIHREYGLGGYTLVSMFEDRMEIVSLGGLPVGVEMADIMLGVSFLRNERLAEIFYRLHLIEAYGTGISKIREDYSAYKYKPSFESTPNAFKVVLPKLVKAATEGGNPTEIIINYLKNEAQFITRATVQTLLGVAVSTARRILNSLEEDGIIVKVGGGRSTVYKLR